MRAFLAFTFAVVACAEQASAPATAPATTASLDVPPLSPPKPNPEKPAVRQAPPPVDENDESPLPNEVAGAEQAFQDARRAMQAGDMTKARALFLRSHRLDPAVGTLLNLAMCEEKLGMRDEAIRHYQAAYDGSMKEGRSERAAIAKSRLDALRGRP